MRSQVMLLMTEAHGGTKEKGEGHQEAGANKGARFGAKNDGKKSIV